MKKSVVLLNMGGATNAKEVETFLKNMFADPNILTVKSSFVRWLIGSIIVFSRKNKARAHYEQIGYSPLLALTQKLSSKLASRLDSKVHIAMRYVPPFAPDAVKAMIEDEIEDVVLLPMYPHYSSTTTKSSIDDFYKAALAAEYHPKMHVIEDFYKNRAFNEVIVEKIKDALGEADAEDFDLVFSAHSLPQKIIDAGDEYQKQIEEHVEILQNMLYSEGVHFRKIHLAYQSKLGPMKWLEPPLGETLHKIKESNDKVLVYPLSFTVDNVETVYELGIEYKDEAELLGFAEYRCVPCPNDDDDFVRVLANIIDEKLGIE